jgi:hypothetical protein
MKTFLLDIWNDLRARRLWPVAVLLLVALVAAPVMLSKKSEEPAVPAPAPAATKKAADEPKGPAALAQVKLDELGEGSGASLSSFDPSDPFAPPRSVLERAQEEIEGAPIGGGTPSGEVGGTGGGTPSGGGTSDTGGTGDTGTGDTGDDGDDGGETKKTTEYTYVIDVTFTANGRKRQIDGMQKLDILPSQASPLLIFMGVTDNAGNAVFLVDSTLQTAGEGRCEPSGAECAFLYLGAGSEQEFTNEDGDSYTLRIDQIRKVKVGATASKKRQKTANAAVGAPPAPRRFSMPLLSDVTSVSSGADINSNSDRAHR